VTLLAGGPPCQPFSKSTYWSTGDAPRLRDPRARTLRAYVDVVEATLPQVLLLENVKGIAFDGKDEGLRLLERRLRKINNEYGTIRAPFLVILVFWLTIIFTSFGVFAPRHASMIAALFVCALSVAGALFLILEMDRPFGGLVPISSAPMREALARLSQ
jgi:hypothetical protein